MLDKMFEVSKVLLHLSINSHSVLRIICRTLMLNKMFEVSKVSTAFVH